MQPMKKTPAEIEAMAKEKYPDVVYGMQTTLAEIMDQRRRRPIWLDGYTSNNELEEFKNRLLETLEGLSKQDGRLTKWNNGFISGLCTALSVIRILSKKDQPPIKKEEI